MEMRRRGTDQSRTERSTAPVIFLAFLKPWCDSNTVYTLIVNKIRRTGQCSKRANVALFKEANSELATDRSLHFQWFVSFPVMVWTEREQAQMSPQP